ncbi:SCO family protein [Metapseudomonas boanensis]|uniref:SCO family protein n=1 Tax=Metapseudomonas boanensis TaxID=2822138 RepID=A0ABS5XK08_9GAMM|nr:SCO family protein [Pseudomonas boanensis]MBT8767390.1 SCO family protein [Pseudomonas boanensis]
MTRIQKTVFVLVALVAVVLGLTVHKVLNNQGQADPTKLLDAGIVLLPQSRSLPALSMTDQNGATVAVDQFKDKWSLVFFGYTFCPDICPTTLAQMRELKGLLPLEARNNVRFIFVSVDPHRDTPQQIKQYLGYFDPEFVGITADVPTLQKFANAVSIPFIPADTSKENYTVDHSGNLVVLGPDGTQRGFIRAPLNNQKLKEQLPGLVAPKG